MKKSFWKKAVAVIAAAGLATFALAGCAGGTSSSSSAASSSAAATAEDNVIRVGASPTPHAEILSQVKDALAEEGYELDIVEYNDYILPNTALEDGELDANYFQHITYLENFNEQNGTHLASAAAIHFEPFGIYSDKITDLASIEDGAAVAVPNDPTNEARALLLLEQEGLITLNPDAGITATVTDIVDNPKNLAISEVEAAQIPMTLPDVAIACINGNYALGAGLSSDMILATESSEGAAAQAYANVIAVKEGTENSPKILALVSAMQSDAVKDFIANAYPGAVVAL